MRGAPQRGFARLISRISCRTSRGTLGLPGRRRDFQRQKPRNPARCHRTIVSGRTIVIASTTVGESRYSKMKIRRANDLRAGRLGVLRRSTFNWCRSAITSPSSERLDRESTCSTNSSESLCCRPRRNARPGDRGKTPDTSSPRGRDGYAPMAPEKICAMPTASVGAPPAREMIVFSPTSWAVSLSHRFPSGTHAPCSRSMAETGGTQMTAIHAGKHPASNNQRSREDLINTAPDYSPRH